MLSHANFLLTKKYSGIEAINESQKYARIKRTLPLQYFASQKSHLKAMQTVLSLVFWKGKARIPNSRIHGVA